ncbi:unnamed protein product [Kluyveromyces dobzhanskii CBS 2104]|uniref:WGS project CCBQ000000000 data, contig 00015 n=1 Tax=Kluyveromyces dobzhanskii CBS 2104 TaxID=1427455 RepID=A0A0A8LCF7_9SACH|nr:unnamed protein product [Kluyveromyces dobzhanskii CBS 2104]
MTVAVVVAIEHASVEIGYAGDFRSVGKMEKCIDWLDDDMEAYTMCRSWFHDIVMYNSKGAKVVISEPMWLSMVRKQRLCKVLFGRLKVNSICFVPNCLNAFIAGGIMNGLYIEVNPKNTEVIAIFDGRILDPYCKSSKLGSADIDEFYKTEEDVYDDDELPLTILLNNVLAKLPIDVRKRISNQVMLVSEDRQVMNYILAQKNVVDTMGPWVGASIYTWNNLLKGRPDHLEVTQSDFNDTGRIPDWHSHKFEV